MRHYPVTTWIIKSETDDPDRALAHVGSKGYTAWIEDENGTAVDEQSLKMNGGGAIKRTLSERLTGPLVVLASVVAGVVVLYLVGLWVE